MAASMVSSGAVSKRTFKNTILSNIVCAFILIGVAYLQFGRSSQFDIISNPLTVTKILSACSLLLHWILHFVQTFGYRGQRFRLGLLMKDILKGLLVYASSILVFHCIAVLFGAAFTNQSAETFHFAMMLSSLTVGPLLIHLELSADTWIRVLVLQSPELGVETTVLVSSITSLIGAWFGAFPISLDWDRPWQAWPITCVLGAVTGHCIGIILASVYISLQFYRVSKFKLT